MSARQQQKDDFTRVFVAVAEDSPKTPGYYSLNALAIATGELGADRPRCAPNAGRGLALYLFMIAVDQSWQGKGLGSELAIDALGRALSAAGEIGFKLIVLEVIDDGECEAFARHMEFCRRLGFPSLQDRPERMFISIDAVWAMFGDG